MSWHDNLAAEIVMEFADLMPDPMPAGRLVERVELQRMAQRERSRRHYAKHRLDPQWMARQRQYAREWRRRNHAHEAARQRRKQRERRAQQGGREPYRPIARRSKAKFPAEEQAWSDIVRKRGLGPSDVRKAMHNDAEWRWQLHGHKGPRATEARHAG